MAKIETDVRKSLGLISVADKAQAAAANAELRSDSGAQAARRTEVSKPEATLMLEHQGLGQSWAPFCPPAVLNRGRRVAVRL